MEPTCPGGVTVSGSSKGVLPSQHCQAGGPSSPPTSARPWASLSLLCLLFAPSANGREARGCTPQRAAVVVKSNKMLSVLPGK